MSGWNDSERRSELPADWHKIRAQQLAYDGHRCTWKLPSGARCPREATDVDHKREKVNTHRIGYDLQSLCEHHHLRKTAAAARRFKAAKKARRYRPSEEHPGRVG